MDVLIFLLAVAAVVWWVRRRRRAARTTATETAPTAAAPAPAAAPSRPATSATTTRPRTPTRPRAAVGRRATGPLFDYASTGRGRYQHDGPYAVVDVETTGFTPDGGDRVIEIAVARVDVTGQVEDEFATLVNPQGRDTGPVFVHHITNDAVANAPTFDQVAPHVLERLDGAVVVAHNASFEDRFLRAELAAAGHGGLTVPALCTLWLARRTMPTPNHKLATLARHAGIPLLDAHAALGDVRATAQLLPTMLDAHGSPLRYGTVPYTHTLPQAPAAALVTRAVALRKGTDGWMHSLMSRLPMSATDVDDDAADAYLDALSDALVDGKIVGDEAKVLARLAGSAGMGAAQLRALNERFLESLREAAFDDDVLTAAELRQLTTAATALSVPDYFDDLTPTGPAAPGPATALMAVTDASLAGQARAETGNPTRQATKPGRTRRCGHCRTPGHYRNTCPQLI